MKKFLLALALLPLCTLIGCSSSDDDTPQTNQELVGNWVEITENEHVEKRHLTLRADMTGHIYISVGNTIDWDKDFTWEATKNILTLTYVDGRSESGSYKIDGNTLIMKDGKFIYKKE